MALLALVGQNHHSYLFLSRNNKALNELECTETEWPRGVVYIMYNTRGLFANPKEEVSELEDIYFLFLSCLCLGFFFQLPWLVLGSRLVPLA